MLVCALAQNRGTIPEWSGEGSGIDVAEACDAIEYALELIDLAGVLERARGGVDERLDIVDRCDAHTGGQARDVDAVERREFEADSGKPAGFIGEPADALFERVVGGDRVHLERGVRAR